MYTKFSRIVSLCTSSSSIGLVGEPTVVNPEKTQQISLTYGQKMFSNVDTVAMNVFVDIL